MTKKRNDCKSLLLCPLTYTHTHKHTDLKYVIYIYIYIYYMYEHLICFQKSTI